MRVIFCDQNVEITKSLSLYLRRRTCGSCCDKFLWELGVEVRPRQVSVLACIVLAGASEGLAGPRDLEVARCRCCGTK